MINPWNKISLTDYENHMTYQSVMQLQLLNKMMSSQFCTFPADSIIILGIAGGNGLEHIDKSKIKKVYGIDINSGYLETCRKRFGDLDDILDLICIDLTDNYSSLPYADLVIANLIIEYIGYGNFVKAISTVSPKYVSCIIQTNSNDCFVSDSPYLHAFDPLTSIHHHIDSEILIKQMDLLGYSLISLHEQILPNDKKLKQLNFKF